jgi:hypothetical protein
MGSIVVAQMLPDSIVKGGTGIAFRIGLTNSRASADLDVTRFEAMSSEDFQEQFSANLRRGWSGFTGVLVVRPIHIREEIPVAYRVQPMQVRLAFQGSTFRTIDVEVTREEIIGTQGNIEDIADDLLELFESIGLQRPNPVALLTVEAQIAQKLHACTSVDSLGQNDRVHDLIDIQLLSQYRDIDFSELARLAQRTFQIRGGLSWPPRIVPRAGWQSRYTELSVGLDVLQFSECISWANDLISRAVEKLADHQATQINNFEA